jgi:hypothetical protein
MRCAILDRVLDLIAVRLLPGILHAQPPSWLHLPSNLGSSAVPSYAALR